jgi:hypothetical protein
MVQYLYDNNIMIYTFAALCGIGLLVRLIVNLVYKHLVKESDNLGETKNKMLKHIKMKFETCFKLKIGVNNVDTFVDKNVLRYRFCGVLLSTWDNFGGQVLFLNLLIVPICAVFGVAYDCEQDSVLITGAVGIMTSAVLILVDKSINLSGKKKMLRLNLLDYLENFCKVRLEQEAFQPEVFEQYRREYLQAAEVNKQISAASSSKQAQVEPKDELNRRREARLKKEEERKLQAVKREEEQKRLEEARKEEERRRLEERRQIAARRREEERVKLLEEKEALEARRAEIKKKAEEKQMDNERRQKVGKEKDNIVHSKEEEEKEEVRTDLEKQEKRLDETAASLAETVRDEKIEQEEQKDLKKTEKEPVSIAQKEISGKDKQRKASASATRYQGVSPQEEKLIEDVLKEFFA